MTVDIASVSVEEKPRVRIVVEPELPLSESRNGNVTLKCRLEDQPSEKYATQFASVKWYLDGELLKHVEKHPGTYSFQSKLTPYTGKPVGCYPLGAWLFQEYTIYFTLNQQTILPLINTTA